MAFSGELIPGIFCPDENIEQFATLYANDNVSKSIIMSSVLNPYDLPRYNQQPVPAEYFPCNCINNNRISSHNRYIARDLHGPTRSSRHCGYGDHNSATSYQNHKPEYPSRGISSTQHYIGAQNHNFFYQPPPGPRYPWL